MGAYDTMSKPKKGPSAPKKVPKKSWSQKAVAGAKDYHRTVEAENLAADVGAWSQAALASRAPRRTSGGGYGMSGGGGGGGYGPPPDPYKEYREQLIAHLNELKAAVPGALDGYLNTYNQRIGNIFAQNQALTGQYQGDIRGVLSRVLAEAGTARDSLQRDLMAQGADTRALGAQASANAVGAQQMGGAAEMYNARLAQLQAMAQADRQAMGAAIDQSARGQLDNSYLQALATLQAIR